MKKIVCRDMTGEDCDFITTGEAAEEVKEKFYNHGAESEIHKERYVSASDEEKAEFGRKLDEYLAQQD